MAMLCLFVSGEFNTELNYCHDMITYILIAGHTSNDHLFVCMYPVGECAEERHVNDCVASWIVEEHMHSTCHYKINAKLCKI